MLSIVRLIAVLAALAPLYAAPDVFSHKKHAGELKLDCAACHSGAAKAERAGFPKASFCQGCHKPLPPAAEKIPSRRVYRIADFVIFAHAKHVAAKVECSQCHGAVTERDAPLELEIAPTMKACVDCHRERKAVNTCTACHELGQ
ncbi:MAG: cytochrome c3 family protein [Bryobacteraceae bacterium]